MSSPPEGGGEGVRRVFSACFASRLGKFVGPFGIKFQTRSFSFFLGVIEADLRFSSLNLRRFLYPSRVVLSVGPQDEGWCVCQGCGAGARTLLDRACERRGTEADKGVRCTAAPRVEEEEERGREKG